jgi:hypothetical protein
MSAQDWLRAVKTEEERLLGEIMKTDLNRQLDAVRTVIAVYEGTAGSASGAGATVASTRANGFSPERSFKKANLFSDVADGTGDVGLRSSPQ